jgi:hypothetical protein
VVLRVPSFVTTLGTFYAVTGIVLTTSHAYPAEIPEPVDGTIGSWLGASPWAHLWWALVIVAFLHVVPTRTRWGLHTIAAGGNPLGASEAGVRTGRIKMGNFMIGGAILLLDEPPAAMGAKEGAMILDLISDLKERGEVSIIVIAHNYAQILEVCDRVNLLQHGTITFDKPTAETSLAELTDLVVREYRSARAKGE